jgi:hypothetical protein
VVQAAAAQSFVTAAVDARRYIMVEFCPHCGQLGGLVRKEQTILCSKCGRLVTTITPVKRVVVDQADELIRQGTAARCPQCAQLVELRGKTLAPHYASGSRMLCPGSAKPPAAAAAHPASGSKDLSALMTREVIRVVSCKKGEGPRIEELTLAYLDKRDRVRVQIDAVRDILGADFRLRDYPPALARPQLAVWAGGAICVVGKRHANGGYQAMAENELAAVVADLQQHAGLFFG